LPESEYIQALLCDLEHEAARVRGRTIGTIFIGGGTPSLFQPDSIASLLTGVARIVAIDACAEITLEANPGTIEAGRFNEFVHAGVNRISIGIQSFNDIALQRIGRIHDSRQAVQAVETAIASGARSVNLDLMYALPGQTLDEAQRDLSVAIALGPDHVSWYQLTLEPNTAFFHNPPLLPDADLGWDMQQSGQQLLAAAGYARYEISAYAKPGARARHNLNYWRFGDYLGIGAGAHGKLTEGRSWRISRTIKWPQPRQYQREMQTLQGPRYMKNTPVGYDDRIFEFMLNALRLVDGFESGLFASRTGLKLSVVQDTLESAAAMGLLDVDAQRIQASELGFRFLNDLVARFLSSSVEN